MKKLVTLSAVALAGATLGVGTTFGWWGDDAKVDDKSPKATLADPVVPINTPPGELNDLLLIQAVPAGEIKSEAKPAKVETTHELKVDIVDDTQARSLTSVLPLNAEETVLIEQLAKELDQSAKHLDEKGEQPEAESQRAMAAMVRGVLSGKNHRMFYGDRQVSASRLKNGREYVAEVREFMQWRSKSFLQQREEAAKRGILVPGLVVVRPDVPQLGIDARGGYRVTAANSKVEQLAEELEQEALHLEEKGQKDAAADKRSLAHRVRETLRGFRVVVSDKNGSFSTSNILVGGVAKGTVATPVLTLELAQNQLPQPEEGPDSAQNSAVKKQLEGLRDLQKELAKRANAQVKSESYTITGGDPSVVGPNERQQRIIVRGVNGVSPLVIQELQKVAKNLEREGHKDQARAIREHSERLQSQAREIETTVQFKAHVQAERERDAAPADRDQNSYGSDSRPRDPNKRDRPREVLRDAEPGPRLSDDSLRRSPRDGEHRDPGDLDAPRRAAPPSAEVYHLLRELHHEITLLRADVRDLKSKLDREQHSNYRERHPEAAGSDGNTRREKSDRRSEGESKQDGQDEDPVLKD